MLQDVEHDPGSGAGSKVMEQVVGMDQTARWSRIQRGVAGYKGWRRLQSGGAACWEWIRLQEVELNTRRWSRLQGVEQAAVVRDYKRLSRLRT